MQLEILASALAVVTVVSAAASTPGWRVLNGITGSFCLHNALLPGNKLMCIERPHTSPYPFINPNTNGTTSVLISIEPDAGFISYVLNPITYNAFCAGHSQAADGGIHVVGGDRQMSTPTHDASKQVDPSVTDSQSFLFNGIDRIRKYTPEASGGVGKWDESVQMTTPRWYPTVVTMGDGDLFIASGGQKNIVFEDLSNTNNPTYEFYPSRYQPAIFSTILNWAFPHNLYPVAFQLPSGKVFLMVSNRTVLIDPKVDPQGSKEANTVEIASISHPDHAPWIYPHTPTSFLLPMKESTNYTAVVVVCGGNKNSTFFASADCLSLQPELPGAAWTPLPNMPNARLMPDATLLPDGTVLLTNGMGWGQAGGNAGDAQYAAAPVFKTDLYDPVSNKWSTLPYASTVARSYHSGALLLADASVITTGSEMANYLDFWGNPEAVGPTAAFAKYTGLGAKPDCYPSNENRSCTQPWELRIEQLTPPYLASGNARPVLLTIAAGTKFTYGSTVGIQLDPKGAPVKRITFVRYTTTTHSTNTDQRLIEPNLLFVNSTYAVFKIPPNGNIAPPGNWHIFGLSKDNVPSVAQVAIFGAGTVTSVPVPAAQSGVFKGSSSIAMFVAVLGAVLLAL